MASFAFIRRITLVQINLLARLFSGKVADQSHMKSSRSKHQYASVHYGRRMSIYAYSYQLVIRILNVDYRFIGMLNKQATQSLHSSSTE